MESQWNNPDLKNKIVPIFAIRDSIVDALGSASPSEFGVIIYASPLLDKYLSVSGVRIAQLSKMFMPVVLLFCL